MSRFRSIAAAISPILVLTAVQHGDQSVALGAAASTPAASAPPSPRQRSAVAPRRRVTRDEVHGRQRQHPDVQRPAGRGAAPAARAGLGAADRRPRQRRRGRLPDDLRQGAARRVDRARTRSTPTSSIPQWMGDFTGPGLPARPDGSRQQRPAARLAGHRPVLPRLQRDATTARSTRSRSTATSTWSITGTTSSQGRPQAAGDVGRLPHDRPEVQRPGPQRRRPAGLRLVHRQEEGRPELLVDHLDRRRPAPEPRAPSEGAFFDTTDMNPLFGQNEAMTQGARDVRKTTEFGPPDELNMDVGGSRGLFTTGRCALTMDWGDIGTLAPGTYAQDKTGATITPGLEAGPRPRDRQARRRATRRPARTRSTA